MRVDLNRLVHQAMRDGIRQFAAHSGGVNTGNDAAFDVLNQRIVAGHQGAGRQGQIFKAHLRQQRDHIINDPVPLAKRVMEGNGHSVLKPAADHRLLQRCAQLTVMFSVIIGKPGRGAMGRIKGLQIPQMGEINVKKFCLIHCFILNDVRRTRRRVPAPAVRDR